MSTRCFSGPQRSIVTSSDRTQAKKDTVIYKGVGSVDRRTGRAHPQRGFVVRTCRDANGRQQRKLTAAQSYSLLDSITRGKYYANPMLQGAGPQAHDESWGAGFLTQQYGSRFYPAPLTGYTAAPDSCAVDSCAWGNPGEPSYQIDHPTGLSGGGGLLAERCIPPPGSKRVSPWHKQAKVGFRTTDAYWGAVNAQPLQGMRFRNPLSLSTQTVSVAPGPKNWLPEPSANAQRSFCLGKSRIN